MSSVYGFSNQQISNTQLGYLRNPSTQAFENEKNMTSDKINNEFAYMAGETMTDSTKNQEDKDIKRRIDIFG